MPLFGRFAALAAPRARNVLKRSWEEAQLAIFDYQFSDNDVIYNQAAVAIQSPRLELDYFALVPATAWQKFSENLSDEPRLYGQHRLVAEAEMPVDKMNNITNQLEVRVTLEVGEGSMLLYRQDRRPLIPDLLEDRIAEALKVYGAVCSA